MLFQFMERDQEADGIMPLCAGEAQEQGDVRLKFRVIAGQLEQGVAEVRLFAVPGSGKQLIPTVQSRCRSGPEPVHEVKAGAERWKGILGTADERSEDAVILKPVCPKGKGRLDLLNIVLIGIANELPEHDERYELHRLLSALLSMELSVDEKLSIIKNEYHILVDDKLREECVGYV